MFWDRTARVIARLADSPNLSLTEAEDIACMESTSFSRFFHQRIGMRFSAFLTAYRVSLAVQEMVRRDEPLTDIATHSGFGCITTFDRSVKRVTGSTPSQLRKSHCLSI